MKGVTANIFRSKSFTGSQNLFAGIDEVTVVGTTRDRGKTIQPLAGGIFEPTDKAPAVALMIREMGDDVIVTAIPVNLPDTLKGCAGPMMGGTFIHTSDARFAQATGVYGAIALHDRYETPQQFRDNSR